MKLLQASIYNSVNIGFFATSILATSVVKFKILMLVFTFKYKILLVSSIGIMNLTKLMAASGVNNSPVFTDL